MIKAKVDLVDFAFSQFDYQSFADLGGSWNVDGGYTFHALEGNHISKAVLVDSNLGEIIPQRAEEFEQLRLIESELGGEGTSVQVGPVDVIFLFDILLHQVAPDWDQLLKMYADQTKCFLIFQPQWIGSDKTTRLLELGEEGYFMNVPHHSSEGPYNNLFSKLEEKHPDYDRAWKDIHHIFQWGITNADLLETMRTLGFSLQFQSNCGTFEGLSNFENYSFAFTKDSMT